MLTSSDINEPLHGGQISLKCKASRTEVPAPNLQNLFRSQLTPLKL